MSNKNGKQTKSFFGIEENRKESFAEVYKDSKNCKERYR